MATLLWPFLPPPAAAKTSQFLHSSTPPLPFPKTHHPSSRKSLSKFHSSRFGNFLDLKPEAKPESLHFDLHQFDPSTRSRLDVIIIGTGPAGLRLAEQVCRYDIKVCSVDPSPLSMWPNNYGVWVDEFESLNLESCFDKTWPMASVHVKDSQTKYLDRPYGRVSRKKLKTLLLERCLSNGVQFHKAKVWKIEHEEFESSILCDDENELKASLIVDASGFGSSFIEYEKEPWLSDCSWYFG
ncbi:hypothetical protein ACFX2I_006800 [Malus domestica]